MSGPDPPVGIGSGLELLGCDLIKSCDRPASAIHKFPGQRPQQSVAHNPTVPGQANPLPDLYLRKPRFHTYRRKFDRGVPQCRIYGI